MRSNISKLEISRFFKNLSALLQAGLPLLRALAVLGHQFSSKYFRQVISQVSDELKKGSGFGAALRSHKKVFSPVEVNLIEAGEKGGFLSEALEDAGQYLEEIAEFKTQLKSILSYPAAVIFASFSCLFLILVFVFPSFLAIFRNANLPVSQTTFVLFLISDFMSNFWMLGLGLLGLTGLLVHVLLKAEKHRIRFERIVLKLPVISRIVIARELAKFCKIFGLLLSQNCKMLDVLQLSAGVSAYLVFRAEIEDVKTKVEYGKNLAEAFLESRLFPQSFSEMIEVGVQTGNLDKVMIQAARYYESEVKGSLKKFVGILEPASTLVAGAVVGGMVFAVFLPLTDFLDKLQ